MGQKEEIEKYCYFCKMRFGVACKRLTNRYENNDFTEQLLECLSIIVDISKNPGSFNKDKSDAYLYCFMKESPTLDLGGNNPFYVISLSNSLPIDLIYILIDECRINRTLSVLSRERLSESHKVCAFDLFDDAKEESFSAITPLHK